tara:strand:- start:2561 stop:4912 length:2352 start_codon:yes stop_codon:yes gene_type:complete
MYHLNLNEKFSKWLKSRNWQLHNFQRDFFQLLEEGKHRQYIISSDIGTGKTVTAFLPFFNDYCHGNIKKVLYISPLRSINTSLEENLKKIVRELNIKCNIEKRTSDDSYLKKKKQLFNIPEILLTTPESLALMIANPDATRLLENLDFIIIDEITELIDNKRGDLLALSLSRINSINKKINLIGMSATVYNFSYLKKWFSFNGTTKIILNKIKKKIDIDVLYSNKIPLSGHSAYSYLELIKEKIINKKTIIFVNTRSQVEILYKDLTLSLDPNLTIGIHHGSLFKEHRLRVESHFASGKIDIIISTSSLELGVDWQNVDQVIIIGTPKNINRLIQRTGRSNHTHLGVAKSYLIPTNQFEYLECISAKKLAEKMEFDSMKEKEGSKDVLCQYLLLLSCGKGFLPSSTYLEIKKTFSYSKLTFFEFNEILSFIKNGGYVLNNYKKWNKVYLSPSGVYKINGLKNRIKTLTNVGTIIDSSNIKIVLQNKKCLGYVDENFLITLKIGDKFLFSGFNLVCMKISSNEIIVKKTKKVLNITPIFWGGNLSISTNLSDEILKNINSHKNFPEKIKKLLSNQITSSSLPRQNEILIETFPYHNGKYLCVYTFLGRQTNHTFSLLLIEFLKNKRITTYNYTINDYSFGIYYEDKKIINLNLFKEFFSTEKLPINFLETFIAKKTFKEISLISGLIDKKNKNKQNFINSDIIFDTLIKYDPNHILLKITKEEVKKFMVNKAKIDQLFKKKIIFNKLDKPSPFSSTLIYINPRIKSHTIDQNKMLEILVKNEIN